MSEPEQDEINEVIQWTMDAEQNGSNYPGMTYEQGGGRRYRMDAGGSR